MELGKICKVNKVVTMINDLKDFWYWDLKRPVMFCFSTFCQICKVFVDLIKYFHRISYMHSCSWPSHAVKVSMAWKICMRWDSLKFAYYHLLFNYSLINSNYCFGNESSRFSLKFTYYHMLFNYSFMNYNYKGQTKSQ